MAAILLIVCLYSSVRLVQYAIFSISARRTNEQLQSIFETAEETPSPETPAAEPALTATATPAPELQDSYQYIGETVLPRMEKMLAINPDTVAWLRIPGGIVDLPVVYRNNTYYLDHDFYDKNKQTWTAVAR